MKEVYLAILERLKTTVPNLLWVDLEKGQMNYSKPPILFPAALIGISLPSTENITKQLQNASCAITIRLCFNFIGNTSNVTPEVELEKSLAYFNLVEEVYKSLQGYQTEYINSLERVNSIEELRPDGYKVITIGFKSSFRSSVS